MTNNALTLNYKNNTIEMTSIFAKKAGIYGSKEYEMLLDARKSFPNFRVNILKPKKGQASRLKDVSLETMFKHISENDNEKKEIMAAFNELVTKDKNGKLIVEDGLTFVEIGQWFLKQYPNYNKPKDFKEILSKKIAA